MNTAELCNALAAALSGTEHENLAVETIIKLKPAEEEMFDLLRAIPETIMYTMVETMDPNQKMQLGSIYRMIAISVKEAEKQVNELGIGYLLKNTRLIHEARMQAENDMSALKDLLFN